ncbi:muconate/chloromuconate family cycloisomerase [Streptomyces aidingensis]|uniref:Muconate cycloisomerase/chloromuconate cycloisomerase n=1 Tax=Streptomyces aidingensis TaxID=910347 RepID=A0A1I1HEW5_9ACTN|nr:muconate/chloromuconate family cycloisomerase [Streptomyces aidingensis]SFC19660.1 muconate cycloisomerase/chloromuconate cycloisomerase [Streptomyces aidingensis]
MSGPRVTAIDTTVVDLPIRRTHRFSGHGIDHQSYLVVRLRTDAGHTGVGEGVSPGGPWWSGESVEGEQQMIEHYLAPALIGRSCLDLHGAAAAMDKVAYGNDFAKAALETALLDAAGQALGVPAYVLLGGAAARERIPVRWALSAVGVAEVAQEAAERIAEGHRALKLKMGALPLEEDLRRVARLIDKIGDGVDYLVDPNGAWDFRTAAAAVHELEAAGVGTVEQPLARSDLAGMAALGRRATALRLMADESVCRPGDAIAAVAARACDAVSVKPGKAGGPLRAVRVAAVAAAAGLSCYGGTALETSIGTAAAAHVYACLPELPLGCELVGPLLLAGDLTTEPVRYRDGDLLVPAGPGLGVQVDWDQVARYARRPS